MMKRRQAMVYYVPWKDQGAGIYLYGTKLKIDKMKTVFLDNPLVPAGTCLMQWASHVNYQETRKEPDLPVLETGREYVFRVFGKAEPEDGILFRLDFYDRQQEFISHSVIRCGEERLVLPEDTYSYTLQMIQTGANRVSFHHIEIYPADCPLYHLIRRNEKEPFHVLFLEPAGNSAVFPDGKYLDRIDNLLVVPHMILASDDWQEKILTDLELAEEAEGEEKIRFLGYGPMSRAASVWASRKWNKEDGHIRSDYQSVYEDRNHEVIPALVERYTKLWNWTGNERKTK